MSLKDKFLNEFKKAQEMNQKSEGEWTPEDTKRVRKVAVGILVLSFVFAAMVFGFYIYDGVLYVSGALWCVALFVLSVVQMIRGKPLKMKSKNAANE